MLLVGSGTGLASDRFDDVPDGHPFHDEINTIADEGITTGYLEGDQALYKPNLQITRMAVAAFVYRMAGSPSGDFSEPFSDIESGHPFYDAIAWASSYGVVEGFNDGEFKPMLNITRQAFAAFLYRLNGSPDGPFTEGFSDIDEGSDFYTEIAWAAENGIVSGYDDGEFKPTLDIKRQAVAAMVADFINGGFAILPAVDTLSFDLDPLNNSGGDGSGTIEVRGDGSVTVEMAVAGLEDALHPQHIHGFDDSTTNSTCPTTADSAAQIPGEPEEATVTDPDTLIAIGEGADEYGGVLLSLEPFQTGASYTFTETYTSAEAAGLGDLPNLANRAIVVHGMTVDGTYAATLPVLCGQIAGS